MKPINSFEIRKSYKTFIFSFVLVTLFSMFCLFLYFSASNREYTLLEEKVKQTDSLYALRRDINTKLDLAILRFKELSKFHNYNANELSRQAILLEDIQNTNAKLKVLVAKNKIPNASFELYEKLTKSVGAMAALQDSLHFSRYDVENQREQLNNCLKVNRAAATKISSGRFGR